MITRLRGSISCGGDERSLTQPLTHREIQRERARRFVLRRSIPNELYLFSAKGHPELRSANVPGELRLGAATVVGFGRQM